MRKALNRTRKSLNVTKKSPNSAAVLPTRWFPKAPSAVRPRTELKSSDNHLFTVLYDGGEKKMTLEQWESFLTTNGAFLLLLLRSSFPPMEQSERIRHQ